LEAFCFPEAEFAENLGWMCIGFDGKFHYSQKEITYAVEQYP